MKSLFTTFICMLLFALPMMAEKDFVVVLDPGHGGKDSGAVGASANEKTINLNVGLAVRDLLKKHKGFKVVMTRSDDRFIELQERANIANRNHGDLFISIHVNSVDRNNKNRRSIAGASVYTLGLHRTASNFEVAKRENSVIELEADYSTKYQGFDPSSPESYIMFELSQSEHMSQSIRFAELAKSELCRTAGRRDRGVHQEGFWVLHAAAMPAVLLELDFICNPDVEKYISSADGQKKMAKAIVNAILEYADINNKDSAPTLVIDTDNNRESAMEAETQIEAVDADAVTWRVQFMAASKSLPANSAQFKGLEKVEGYTQGGLYKYTAGGDFSSERAAEEYARKHVRSKFPQAFVIKWKNGTRIN